MRPAPAPTTGGPGWWLVDESAQVLAGPFDDRIDADWAALSGGLPAVSVFGARRSDGVIAPRPSPEERAWLAELSDQLDRLPADWDELLSDTDPLTTLVVEVTAALVEAGLPLFDAPQGSPSGGVSLMPEEAIGAVVVSWRAHDRMSLHRGAAADATVQQSMNVVVADILANLGFVIEPFGGPELPRDGAPLGAADSRAEDLRLLRGELLLGQDPGVPELTELAELVDHVGRRRRRRGRRRAGPRTPLPAMPGLTCRYCDCRSIVFFAAPR